MEQQHAWRTKDRKEGHAEIHEDILFISPPTLPTCIPQNLHMLEEKASCQYVPHPALHINTKDL